MVCKSARPQTSVEVDASTLVELGDSTFISRGNEQAIIYVGLASMKASIKL